MRLRGLDERLFPDRSCTKEAMRRRMTVGENHSNRNHRLSARPKIHNLVGTGANQTQLPSSLSPNEVWLAIQRAQILANGSPNHRITLPWHKRQAGGLRFHQRGDLIVERGVVARNKQGMQETSDMQRCRLSPLMLRALGS